MIRLRFRNRLENAWNSAMAWLLGGGGLYYADKTPVKIQRVNEKDDLN